MSLGLGLFAVLLVLMLMRVPLSVAMFVAGSMGYVWVVGDGAWLAALKSLAWSRLSNSELLVIPLFLLMGQFATQGGLSAALFRVLTSFIGHRRGGVAMASVGACAGFGAICGSSLATAATMSEVALRPLQQLGYSGRLATGSLAAGGTLGILIPPSVPLVIYGMLTDESIGRLFLAAVVPGVLAMLGYLAVIRIWVLWRPREGPRQQRIEWGQRLGQLPSVLPVLLVFLVVIVGIYDGWATPTEAAALGAAACGVVAVASRRLTRQHWCNVLLGTAQASGMILTILLGADVLNSALALSGLPNELAVLMLNLEVHPLSIVALILVIYLILGCFMDSLAMILLTIPIFFPIITGLDLFGLSQMEKTVWFGILVLTVVEVGLVSPPVGLNLFIVNRMAITVPLRETMLGVLPFLASDALRIVLLLLFPGVSLFLIRIFPQ